MAFQNRVAPTGEILAIAQRGRWMGNRGILHEGTSIARPWQHPHWIICQTDYKGWSAAQWTPHRYTPLFFLDEAVALAAGHRPCALCRNSRWRAFVAAWRLATGDDSAMRDDIDRRLHRERRNRDRTQRTHQRPWHEVPAGAFVVADEVPARVEAESVVPWTPAGYSDVRERPTRGYATVLTPAITVDVLLAGYFVLE